MKTFNMCVILLLFAVSISVSQVITIEEYFENIMPSKTINKMFSSKLREGFYAGSFCSRYLAITNFKKEEVKTPDGLRTIKKPSDIDIFSSTGLVSTFANETNATSIIGFIEKENKFIAWNKNSANNRSSLEIFDIDGRFIKSLDCSGLIYSSPNAIFFYSAISGHLTGPILILDEECNESFRIPTNYDYEFEAPSDSTLIVLHYKSISLWNIQNKQKLWETEIPREDYITDISGFGITYSNNHNIIVVRDLIGCYCFDFQGNFLWSHEKGLNDNRLINLVGVSESNGTVAITFVDGNAIFLKLFNRAGEAINELNIDFGANCNFVANWGFVADVFSEIILLRFIARVEKDKRHVTGILYNNGENWISGLVDGFWYILQSENETKSLIGFDDKNNEVTVYDMQ